MKKLEGKKFELNYRKSSSQKTNQIKINKNKIIFMKTNNLLN